MEYTDAFILGASALIEALPAEAPTDPQERLRVINTFVDKAKGELGSHGYYEHEEWLAVCAGMSNVGEYWVETGLVSKGGETDE